MNADLESFALKLAQQPPARLTHRQRQRLHDQITAQLSAPATPAALRWQLWLAWSSAAVTLALVLFALAHRSQALPGKTQADQLVVSNLWPAQVRSLEDTGSSNVRQNQFLYSISSSNLPVEFGMRKI